MLTLIRPAVITFERTKEKLEPFVQVILLNDNIHTCSFVVYFLVEVDFGLSLTEAKRIMRTAHRSDSAVVGIYQRSKAESLIREISSLNLALRSCLRFRLVS